MIAAHGRHYLVAPADGGAIRSSTFPRGKRSEVAVGDRVTYEQSSADQGVIVRISERRNLLYRSDQFKSKLFAANLDQLLIVLATRAAFQRGPPRTRADRGRGARTGTPDRAEQDRRGSGAAAREKASRAVSGTRLAR